MIVPVPYDRGLTALMGRESLDAVRESNDRREALRRAPCARCRHGLPDEVRGTSIVIRYCLACKRQTSVGWS